MARGPVSWLGCSAAALPDGVPSVGGLAPPQLRRFLTVAGAAPALHRLPVTHALFHLRATYEMRAFASSAPISVTCASNSYETKELHAWPHSRDARSSSPAPVAASGSPSPNAPRAT